MRRAESKDIENLHQLINSAYRGQSSRIGWTTEADFLDGQRTDTEQLREFVQSSAGGIYLL